MAIPKKAYFFHMGQDYPIMNIHIACLNSFYHHCPEVDIILVTDCDIENKDYFGLIHPMLTVEKIDPSLIVPDYVLNSPYKQHAIDYLKLHYAFHYGGLYSDLDIIYVSDQIRSHFESDKVQIVGEDSEGCFVDIAFKQKDLGSIDGLQIGQFYSPIGSKFIREWLETYSTDYRPDLFGYNGVDIPFQLLNSHFEDITVLSYLTHFFPLCDELFNRRIRISGAWSLHFCNGMNEMFKELGWNFSDHSKGINILLDKYIYKK